MSELQPELLAWSALLGRWIDLVKAGHGMPEIGDGGKWQASVASIIELQATSFALDDLETLEEPDRPLARDRGCLLVESAHEKLAEAWGWVEDIDAWLDSKSIFMPNPENPDRVNMGGRGKPLSILNPAVEQPPPPKTFTDKNGVVLPRRAPSARTTKGTYSRS